MHWLLLYDVVDDYLERRAPFRSLHLAHAHEAQRRGELLLAGAFADPADGAALVFRSASRETAERFAREDPYVKEGLVTSWRVREWSVVIGGKASSYLDSAGRDDVLAGGARLIPVQAATGTFNVWTKRIGNSRGIRLLLLHGGPGSTHEYLEAFDSYLPAADVEFYYYDQLGSGFSDKPDDPSLWDLDRFVDEVEQVRRALGLGREDFVLYGHSWGGILAIEYALRYQQHLRGLVVSNMMSSVPAYNAYAERVLMPSMDQRALAEIKALEAGGDIENPRYMELLHEQHYVHHVLRMPVAEWPDPVQRGFAHINPAIYVSMQGPSELGISPDASLALWDRTEELAGIDVPALVIGATHDTMDPSYMQMMATRLPKGRYLLCPDGSHLAMYDDQVTYFTGLVEFLGGLAAVAP